VSLDSSLDLVTELLACQTERRSCTVVVAAEGVETRLHFEEGTLVYAEEGTAGKALGRLLVEEGKLTEEQYGKLLDALAEAGLRGSTARLGDLAVKRGYLTRKELGLSLFSQVRRKVVQAIVWESPAVRVSPPEVESGSARARFPTTLEPLVLSAFRKLSPEALERRLASVARGPVTLDPDASLDDLVTVFRAKPEERAVLEARLASTSGTSPGPDDAGEGLAFLAALHATGRLTSLAGPPSHRKKTVERLPAPPAAAGFPRLSRAAKKQLLAKVSRQKVSADESGMMPAVGLEPEPGTPAAKLRAERAFQEGKAHLAKGRETLAKAEFWRAHRLVPTAAEYELYLGWLTAKGDEQRAAELESLALRAKRQDPELGFASYVLSHLALLRGDVERAEAEQQRAARLGVRGSTLPPSLGIAQAPFRLDSSAFAAPRTTVSVAKKSLPFRAGKPKKAVKVDLPAEVVPHPMDAGWDDIPGPKSAAALPTTNDDADANANPSDERAPDVRAPTSKRTPLSDAPPPVPAVESDVFEEAAPFSFLLPKVSKSSAKLEAAAPVPEEAANTSAPESAAIAPPVEAPAAEKTAEASTTEPAPSVRDVTSTEAASDAPASSASPKDAAAAAPAPDESAPASTKAAEPEVSTAESKPRSEPEDEAPRSKRTTSEKPATRTSTGKSSSKKPARATTDSDSDEVAPVSEPVPQPPGSTGRGPLFVGVGVALVLAVVGWVYLRDTTPVRPEPPPPVTTASVSATTTASSASEAGVAEAGSTSADASPEDAETRDVAAQNADASADARAVVSVDAAASARAEDAAPPNPHGKRTGEIVAEDAPRGRRVFVDGRAVGETPAIVVAPCGTHEVKVGSKGNPQTVDIPCGGRVSVRP
jgi:hypothetical protein